MSKLDAKGKSRMPWMFCVAVVYVAMALFRLGSYDLQTDEGRFGISGLNILADYHQLATVSEDPLGGPGTKPFLYPTLVAASLSIFGKDEFAVRFVNVALVFGSALVLYKIVDLLLGDIVIAGLSACLFLLNPGSLTYARNATPEPSVVFFGLAGVCGCVLFYRTGRARWALVCGAALGLAYLSKLWLVLPFGLSCLGLFAVKFFQERKLRSVFLPLAGFAVFLAVSSLHMLVVSLLEPNELAYWKGMYLGTTLSQRVNGAGIYDPSMWFRPWWFYLAAFFKASFFGLPFFFLGCAKVWKDRDVRLGAVLIGLLAALPILSLFIVKEATYLFPIFPAIAILTGVGLTVLLRSPDCHHAMGMSVLCSVVLAVWLHTEGVMGLGELGGMIVLYLIYLTAAFTIANYRALSEGFAVCLFAAAMLFTAGVAIHRDMTQRTYYREIAQYFASAVQAKQPNDIIFRAPEYAAMEFYLFRSGEYWNTFYFREDSASFEKDLANHRMIFYLVDRSGQLYGGKPSDAEWQMLLQETREITGDVGSRVGHDIPVRVFVPAPGGANAS